MNSRITNKLIPQTFRFNRYLSAQQSVNKNKHHAVAYDYKNKNQYSGLCFPKTNFQKHLQCAPVPLYLNFQKRNLSYDSGIHQSAGKITEQSAGEVISKIPTDSWPALFQSISESKIVGAAQEVLLKVHETTGLPWWATIMLTAYTTRALVTLPFSVLQIRNTAKLQQLKPKMEQIVKECKRDANRAVSYHGWTESMARAQYQKDVRAEYNKLIVEHNCHPFKSYVIILIQLPIWISFSFATRNLSYMIPRGDPISEVTFLEMMVGGFGWIKNLTIGDQYMILPITCALLNLIIIESHILFRDPTTITKLQKIQTAVLRVVSLAMVPVAMYIPSGTVLYWISSSSFGLLQAFLFQSSRFHRLIGVPNMEGQSKHPYRLFYNNLKSRLHLTSK